MRVLVDTNVISDLAYGDSAWKAWAGDQLIKHAGHLWINPLIYAELCVPASSSADVETLVGKFELHYAELPREALYFAGMAFKTYRQRGGAKTAPLPDFFIGAHAQAAGFTLLTRDAARFQTYFPTVPLICP